MNKVEFDFSLPRKEFKEKYNNKGLSRGVLYSRRYYANNRENVLMTKKQYREDNKKEINERVRQKRIINNIEIKKRDREYYKKNRDKRLQDRKRYYLSHKDDILKKSICHNKEKGYNALHAKTYREIKKKMNKF